MGWRETCGCGLFDTCWYAYASAIQVDFDTFVQRVGVHLLDETAEASVHADDIGRGCRRELPELFLAHWQHWHKYTRVLERKEERLDCTTCIIQFRV